MFFVVTTSLAVTRASATCAGVIEPLSRNWPAVSLSPRWVVSAVYRNAC